MAIVTILKLCQVGDLTHVPVAPQRPGGLGGGLGGGGNDQGPFLGMYKNKGYKQKMNKKTIQKHLRFKLRLVSRAGHLRSFIYSRFKKEDDLAPKNRKCQTPLTLAS